MCVCVCVGDFTWPCKKCDFYLRKGNFIMFFYDKPIKWPVAKKNLSKYSQLIHMILQEGNVIKGI
jgi:hypothetical protein